MQNKNLSILAVVLLICGVVAISINIIIFGILLFIELFQGKISDFSWGKFAGHYFFRNWFITALQILSFSFPLIAVIMFKVAQIKLQMAHQKF